MTRPTTGQGSSHRNCKDCMFVDSCEGRFFRHVDGRSRWKSQCCTSQTIPPRCHLSPGSLLLTSRIQCPPGDYNSKTMQVVFRVSEALIGRGFMSRPTFRVCNSLSIACIIQVDLSKTLHFPLSKYIFYHKFGLNSNFSFFQRRTQTK